MCLNASGELYRREIVLRRTTPPGAPYHAVRTPYRHAHTLAPSQRLNMAPKARAKAAPAPAGGSPARALLIMLLASTAMAVALQFLVKLGATDKTSLTVSWTMYLADVLLSLGTGSPRQKRNLAPRVRAAATLVPALDVAGCVLAYGSLERLGAGPFTMYFSAILPVSAVFSRGVLGKRLSGQQAFGIAAVSAGLMARSWLSNASTLGDDALGIALALASTFAYAGRTVSMEYAQKQPGSVTGAELSASIGRWGFVALSAWQLGYTVPRWASLVSAPSAAAGVTATRAAVYHAAYVATRAAFVLSQNEVIRTSGATGVGLVTAMRSVAVGLVSSLLFCGTMPSQCLNSVQLACAAVVVAGGVTYALAVAPTRARGKAD